MAKSKKKAEIVPEMTEEQAPLFWERWREFAADHDLSKFSEMEIRVYQTMILMHLAVKHGWKDPNEEGVAQVRERWAKIRRFYREKENQEQQ